MCLYAGGKKTFFLSREAEDVASPLIASNVGDCDVQFRALCSLSSCLFHLQPRWIPVLDHILKESFVLMAKLDS